MKTRSILIAAGLLWLCSSSPAIADDALLAKGQEIFQEVCARCHTAEAVGKLGPGLKDVTKRRSEEWLNRWIKSPRAMLAAGDITAKQLREKNKYDLTMPTLPIMQKDENRKAVIAYLKTL